MKNWIKINLLALIIISAFFAQGQVAITTDGSSADASAMLDVKSTNKGLLVPRLTMAQRDGIASPATGLIIYQTDNTVGFYYYNGSSWERLITESESGADGDWTISGNNIYSSVSGNVGIGTGIPADKLTVDGDIDLHQTLFFNKQDGRSTKIRGYGDDLVFYAPDGKLKLDEGTITIDCANNRIGFGTTSPSYDFQVQKQATFMLQSNFNGGAYFNNSTYFSEYLKHNGDENTYIRFINDEILINADGVASNYTFSIKKGINSWIGLYPTTHLKGNIGYASQAWYSVHADYFYAGGSSHYQTYSDKRIKTDIYTLSDASSTITKLNPVSYKLKQGYSDDQGKQFGLLAQEVKDVLPDIVQYDSNVDLYSVSYVAIIPILIKAFQEQQQQINELKKQIEILQTENK